MFTGTNTRACKTILNLNVKRGQSKGRVWRGQFGDVCLFLLNRQDYDGFLTCT